MVEAGDIITLTAGAWRLRTPLAGSSYGVLWRAESVRTGEPAAIKLVNRAQMDRAMPARQAGWRDAFDAEIAFLRGLQPWDARHIVRLLDSGMHDGLPALALELLDSDLGAHLTALRGRGAQPDAAQALAWIGQINAALAKVHQYGWRYLDLKPANLLLDLRTHSIKLADFGTNRPAGADPASAYAGTAAWQAPEQFFADADGRYATTARSDYFVLGALLYYLVSGVPLRYCTACADAFRTAGALGAATLREQHGGAMPTVLALDEAALFLRQAASGRRFSADSQATLLALLRALLAPRPADRPRTALDISRLIARAAGALSGPPGASASAAVSAFASPSPSPTISPTFSPTFSPAVSASMSAPLRTSPSERPHTALNDAQCRTLSPTPSPTLCSAPGADPNATYNATRGDTRSGTRSAMLDAALLPSDGAGRRTPLSGVDRTPPAQPPAHLPGHPHDHVARRGSAA